MGGDVMDNEKLGLTRAQMDALDFIKGYLSANGIAPNYEEIRVGLGLSSKAGVKRLLDALEARGHIARKPSSARSIAIVSSTSDGDPPSLASALQLPEIRELIDAANGVIGRWDSPDWKHGHTLDFIARLRAATDTLAAS
jgi:repressor LexA